MQSKIIIIALMVMCTLVKMNAQVKKAEIVATGLTCSMCSNAINKQLKSLAEVDSVTVDLNTNTFVVYVKKDAVVSPRTLKERIEKAGFFVGAMTVSMNFENTVIPEDKRLELDGMTLVILESKSEVLNGTVQVKIMDKGYVTQKEHKKLTRSLSKVPTYNNGDENDYHVNINGI
jgi:copper chaperone CopZ